MKRMRLKRYGRWGVLALTAMVLLSCTSAVISTKQTGLTAVQKVGVAVKGDYETTDAYERSKPRRIAILPFSVKRDTLVSKISITRDTEETERKAREIVRRTFYNHFSSLPYLDTEMFRVDSLLRAKDLTDPEQIHQTDAKTLGQILNVDAIVYGTITHYDKVFLVVASDVAVGAAVEMRDARTGELLWRGKHVSHMASGGIATDPVGLILKAIFAAWNLRDINIYRTSDDLFREMVKAIPRPTIAEAEAPPNIQEFVSTASLSVKKAGDVLSVGMRGDAGLRATFDIGDFKKGLPMREVAPGQYEGTYLVVPGDNVENALVVGRLENEAGISAQWIDALGYAQIDTTPPSQVSETLESSRDQAVYLRWKPNTEPDLAKYRVYRSETPLTGFTLHAEIEETEYLDPELTNYKPYYYHVAAVDRVGNEGEPSSTVRGMGVPKGPTPAGGELRGNTSWYAAAGPYVLEQEVVVPDEIFLAVEPGTTIISKGPGIRVLGSISAEGSADRVIVFQGQDGAAWEGLTLENKVESELDYCTVKGAEIGILIRSAGTAVRHSELTLNGVGVRIEGTHAKPEIASNKIIGNRGNGVEVTAGAEPKLVDNEIASNGGKALDSVAASPYIARNTVVHNKGGGLFFAESSPVIEGNIIHDNGVTDLFNHEKSQTIQAVGNYWGTSNGREVLTRITGRVEFNPILDAEPPEGKPVTLTILDTPLPRSITQDSFLVLSKSPYVVAGETVVDDGAVLYVEAGVTLKYTSPDSVIVVKKGGINARGRSDAPILFVSASSSPGPGDYRTAVRFLGASKGAGGVGQAIVQKVGSLLGSGPESFFQYCVFAHAETALDIHHGRPDITYSFIGYNRQSGVACRNDARPNIANNTLYRNTGTAAIECFGMAAPRINLNNVSGNPFAIQSFSSITVDARSNWWGSSEPNPDLFLGNVEYQPSLTEPNPDAFTYGFE